MKNIGTEEEVLSGAANRTRNGKTRAQLQDRIFSGLPLRNIGTNNLERFFDPAAAIGTPTATRPGPINMRNQHGTLVGHIMPNGTRHRN